MRRVDFEGLDQTCCIEALPTVSLFTNKVFLEYFLCHNWQYILDERIYSELFSEVRHCTTMFVVREEIAGPGWIRGKRSYWRRTSRWLGTRQSFC